MAPESYKEKLERLEKENLELKKVIEHMANEFQKLKGKSKHNARGAGRKRRFTDSEIYMIKKYRLQGKTLQELSELFNCSIGLIHNILKED